MARAVRRTSRTLRDLAELEAFSDVVGHSATYRPISTQDFLPQAQLYGLGGFGALAYLGDDDTEEGSGDWTDALKSVTDVVGSLATTGAKVYQTVTGGGQTAAQKTGVRPAIPGASSNTMLYVALAAGAALLLGGGLLAAKRR